MFTPPPENGDLPPLVDQQRSPYWPAQPGISSWAFPGAAGGGAGPVYPSSASPLWPTQPHSAGATPAAPPAALWGSTPQTSGWYHPAHTTSRPHTPHGHQPTTPGQTWGTLTSSPNLAGSGSHTTPVTPSRPLAGLSTSAFPGWNGSVPGHYYPHAPQPMSAPATYEPAFSPWGLPPGVAGGGPHSAGPYTGYPTGNQPPWATPPKRRKSKREYRRRSSSRRRADNGYDDDSADDGHVVEDGWINVGTMRRAASQGTPVRRGSMHRTASSGGAGHPAYPSVMYGQTPTPGGQVPGYLQADIFNEQNLARRPRDWRADYTPKSSSGISSLLSLGKNRSDVKDYVDNMRRTLHPLLHYQPGSTPISYDMHVEPSPFSIDFPNLRRQPNEIDFAQLAVQPSAEFMRLFHPRLPWYIDVVASHPNGITLFNILSTIYRQLHTPIQPRHYYNEELNAADRAELTSAFETRCKGDLAVIMHGILHIDFLGRRTVFEGLVRGPKGMWEIRTNSVI